MSRDGQSVLAIIGCALVALVLLVTMGAGPDIGPADPSTVTTIPAPLP